MGLAWELHELIQDHVDGKLSSEREAEVQAFLDKHPNAQLLADQYRKITQPDLDIESVPQTDADRLADKVMTALPTEPWYAFFAKRDFLSSFAVLAITIAIGYLADFAAIASWLQFELFSNISSISLITDSVLTVLERMNGLVPALGASVLIAAFYGMLDRIMALGHKVKRT